MRADPLHRAFSDRHFLRHRVLYQLVYIANQAPSSATLLAIVVARVAVAGALAGVFALPALLAERRDAGNADVFAVAAILILGNLFRGADSMADWDKAATAMGAQQSQPAMFQLRRCRSARGPATQTGFTPDSESVSNQR